MFVERLIISQSPHSVVMRSRFLFLVVTILQASGSATKLNGWFSCSMATFSDEGSQGDIQAECAIYRAPLCYPGICETPESVEGTVDIFVKRFPATTNADTAPNVWLLQGGPGFSSTAMEQNMATLSTLLKGSVNVYTMDHRGTGRSTRFDCAAAQVTTTGSPSGPDIEISEIPACAQDLENQFGDLASFSTTSAAMDLKTLISKYTNKANTIVYGVSYGTILVERLMHLAPPKVVGYVLDSVATSSGAGAPAVETFPFTSTYDTYTGEVGDEFMALCQQDKECRTRFNRNGLKKSIRKLINQFDKDPNSTCATQDGTTKPSYALRQALGSMLQDASMRTLISPFVYRSLRCSADDVKVLTYFYKTLYSGMTDSGFPGTKTQDDSYTSNLLNALIQYSELWESPQPSMKEMIQRFTDVEMSDGGIIDLVEQYCAFSKEDSPACNKFTGGDYEGNGIIYDRDQYWNKSATIPKQASVLLLSGSLDARTPPKFAKYLLEALKGDNKEHVTFDYATHGVLVTTLTNDENVATCGMQVLASYVKNNGDLTRLDKSCLDDMPAFNMTAPTEIVNQYFKTDGAYDGKYLGEDDSGSTSQ